MAKRTDNSHPGLAPAFAFLLALCVFLSLFHDIYVDDAYITLSYARTFAASGTWGMHPGFVSNAATSPLDVLLLSGLIKLGLPGVWAIYVSECLLAVAIFCALTFISRRVFGSDLWAYLGTLALFTNPLLISTSGLETYLFIAVLLGCVIAFFTERYFLLGLAAGLLVLARPDGVLLLVPLFALMVWERRGLDFVKVLIGFATVVGAWGFVSWLYLGSAIPDTYFIKRKEASWHDISFAKGLAIYYAEFPAATLLSLIFVLFIPFGVAHAKASQLWRVFVVLVGGLALVHYIAYSLLNLPPYHWYYGIFIGAVTLIGSAGLLALADHFPRSAIFGLIAIVALAGGAISARAALIDKQMPIQSNLGKTAQYRAIADWLNAHTLMTEYQIFGELGVIQYYGRADAVNSFSDRQILREFVAKLPNGSAGKKLAELNFAHLAVRPPVRSDYRLEEDCKDARGALKTWTTSSSWIESVLWCLRRESSVSPASPRPD